ncbi:MAG TPA: type IV-A pilus assembly ATPase PilB [Marinobacter hydrocarbonoclasticus]|uniref:type IV-A pilus assembly ATPase PilB n=1 Tax=unclassified Marinobacter TaxID=83889 RepID=UPI000C4BF190|nr:MULTISPECIES: type IV-A pilus assembly ATPase PilB [unclassified Marinobacter]MAC23614.1 type IV-A pilus assembly ATPase PilB [Marinobacter sp.]MBH92682.1 type IV-A pilus assembly ATPase PilB [Marinobacter sp.]HCL38568.1 type IV-A pilus assembly ATPase PilB [Marinobacter nauticus]HCR46061.1 type IV-A pilus assembly ATPase PilB [Marinobacter nauticus]|tara:strand:- start:11225 stop:12943 length:1719 start_codon:yes stop_codon:yes gene_type:complete
MATNNRNVTLTGLARRFVDDGLLDEETAKDAFLQASQNRIPLITYLTQNQLADSSKLAFSAAMEFGVSVMDLDSFLPEMMPDKVVDEKLLRKHNALPLYKRGNRLFIAVSDPTNIQALDEIKFNTGLSTDAILVDDAKLRAAIDRYLESHDSTMGDLEDADLEGVETEGGDHEDDDGSVSTTEVDDAPIVKYVNKMLLDAIRGGASDIHFEPYEKAYRVRYRTDGILKEVSRPSIKLAPKISARVKIMAQLDISERRVPQDGRIKLKLSKTKAIDFRVNTLPTLWGEKIVLRILDPSQAQLGIDVLGYEEDQKEMYLEALEQPQGMILVTGPTGSGKTVSLYTGLNILNTTERNISTAEDPAEINLEGINQVNVNTKVGLGFAEALRAFLRQDPDVIMVGEIRDLETANIAIKAAQTGHLVLSTLHTNSAAETLTRMMNMGVPAFNIATSVSLIIAQRLGRRLCNSCKQPSDVPQDVLLKEGFTQEQIDTGFTLYRPKGCDKCNGGYKGRVGIYEVVRITDELANMIMEEASSIKIAKQAQAEGFRNLRQSALMKVIQGVTSLEEANRVTKD